MRKPSKTQRDLMALMAAGWQLHAYLGIRASGGCLLREVGGHGMRRLSNSTCNAMDDAGWLAKVPTRSAVLEVIYQLSPAGKIALDSASEVG